jgi:acetyl-CoA carboxylase biotin carboxyl carrier protein
MTLDEIKQLVDFIRDRELSEFELERADVKLRIKSGTVVQTVMAAPAVAAAVVAAAPAAPSPAAVAPAGEDLAIITSPIVGTFYRAAEPGAKPFVDTGDMVRKGQVLCIIEAMKLMNEIDSEYEGEIVSVYVQNGQAVQYGERLFAVRLKS